MQLSIILFFPLVFILRFINVSLRALQLFVHLRDVQQEAEYWYITIIFLVSKARVIFQKYEIIATLPVGGKDGLSCKHVGATVSFKLFCWRNIIKVYV